MCGDLRHVRGGMRQTSNEALSRVRGRVSPLRGRVPSDDWLSGERLIQASFLLMKLRSLEIDATSLCRRGWDT